jgi:hypothetical protein
LAAFFHAARRSWALLLQSLPCREARTPLGARCSLAVIHRRAWTRRSRPCHRPFHRRPRFRAVAWIPGRLRVSFPRAPAGICERRSLPPSSARFPVPLGPAQRNRPVPPASPASELSSSLQVERPVGVAPGGRAPPLLEFLPSRAFSLHASESLPLPGCSWARPPFLGPWLAGRSGPRSSPSGQEARPRGPLGPRSQVRPPEHEYLGNLVDGCQPTTGWPAPPLGDAPSPMALESRAHPVSWPSERRSTWRAALLRRDRWLFWGFLPPRRLRDFGAPLVRAIVSPQRGAPVSGGPPPSWTFGCSSRRAATRSPRKADKHSTKHYGQRAGFVFAWHPHG